jgi:MFS family permease
LGEAQMALVSTVATLTAAGGALLGGALADRLGRRRTILGAAVMLAAAHLAFAHAPATWAALLTYQLGGGLAGGVLYASSIALCMDFTDPQVAATHFQFFMAMMNVRSAWASWAGGKLAEVTGRPAMFTLAAALELAPLALLLVIGVPPDTATHRRPER